MSDESGFLEAIIEEPDDDGLRLIYADWLEERGDPRGEFIRLEVELARGVEDEARRFAMTARRDALEQQFADAWLGSLGPNLHRGQFRRGLLEDVCIGGETFLEEAQVLFDRHPVRDLFLILGSDTLAQVAALPFLNRLRSLRLAGTFTASGLRDLSHSTGLTDLRFLHLGGKGVDVESVRVLV